MYLNEHNHSIDSFSFDSTDVPFAFDWNLMPVVLCPYSPRLQMLRQQIDWRRCEFHSELFPILERSVPRSKERTERQEITVEEPTDIVFACIEGETTETYDRFSPILVICLRWGICGTFDHLRHFLRRWLHNFDQSWIETTWKRRQIDAIESLTRTDALLIECFR